MTKEDFQTALTGKSDEQVADAVAEALKIYCFPTDKSRTEKAAKFWRIATEVLDNG